MNRELAISELEWLKAADWKWRTQRSSQEDIECTLTLLNDELIRLTINPLTEYTLTDTDGEFIIIYPSLICEPRLKFQAFLIKHNLKKKALEDFIFHVAKEYYILGK